MAFGCRQKSQYMFEQILQSLKDADNFSEEVFAVFLKRYVMTKEQLEQNGYPVEDPNIPGGGIVSNKTFYRNSEPQPKDPFKRRFVACLLLFYSNYYT